MRYAALYSGGKDSNLALWLAQERGMDVSYLITVFPRRDDSYMFHKPNLLHVPMQAESLNIPLVLEESSGEKEKELTDLENALDSVEIDGVITGAVASRYQMDRIERMAHERGLDVFSPLWGMDPDDLMNTLMEEGFECIVVEAAALGLNETWLGRSIDREFFGDLKELNRRYGVNVAGEGGEYESFVLDAPNFEWGFTVQEGVPLWDGLRGTYDIIKLGVRTPKGKTY